MPNQITLKEYWDEINEIAEGIAEDTKKEGEDREWAFDRLWETIDGHEWIIYYWAQPWVLVHTSNDDAYFEMTGATSMEGDSAGSILQPLAFYAMHQDAAERLEYELGERDID